MRKVVVTGTGVVSPFGAGVNTLIDSLTKGKSSVISMAEDWQKKIPGINCLIGAPLKEELPAKDISRQYRKSMGQIAIMAFFAVREAIEQAGISASELESGNTGIAFSSSMGSVRSLETFFKEYLDGNLKNIPSGSFFQVMSHTCAANIAHLWNVKGRVFSPDAACTSSTQSIGMAYETIKHGIQDIMICGGADELDAVVCGSFDLLNATSYQFNDTPTLSPRPFDHKRDGTVCGEGAGCLILESEESALKRKAPILAEVAGFSTISDGTHLAQPHTESIQRCIETALSISSINPDEIDYINAHATGTQLGDAAESHAIKNVFGSRVVPVSSLKGNLGHTLGASGALETAASIQMMQNGELFPNLNLEKPGDDCADIYYLKKIEKKKVRVFMKNSFAFGGINSVLLLKRYGN